MAYLIAILTFIVLAVVLLYIAYMWMVFVGNTHEPAAVQNAHPIVTGVQSLVFTGLEQSFIAYAWIIFSIMAAELIMGILFILAAHHIIKGHSKGRWFFIAAALLNLAVWVLSYALLSRQWLFLVVISLCYLLLAGLCLFTCKANCYFSNIKHENCC